MSGDKPLKKFIIQLGMGVDQHGQDVTKAAQKAIKNAISNNCLVGLTEICDLKDVKETFEDMNENINEAVDDVSTSSNDKKEVENEAEGHLK